MNRSIKLFASRILLMAVFVFITVSCSETDSPTLDGVPQGLYIQFKSNGTQYTISDPITIELSNKKIDGLQGADASLVSITLYMPLNPTVGTHFMTDTPSDDDSYGGYFTLGNNSVDIISNAGILTITSITDDFITGTFSFSGMNGSAVVEVTNGSFVADVD